MTFSASFSPRRAAAMAARRRAPSASAEFQIALLLLAIGARLARSRIQREDLRPRPGCHSRRRSRRPGPDRAAGPPWSVRSAECGPGPRRKSQASRNRTRRAQPRRRGKSAQIAATLTGDGGVSRSSSAAGRNSRSTLSMRQRRGGGALCSRRPRPPDTRKERRLIRWHGAYPAFSDCMRQSLA